MTLDLTLDQPPEPPAIAEPAVLATVVTIDGVVVRIAARPDGSVALLPDGNRAPLAFDRFQANAIREALGVEM